MAALLDPSSSTADIALKRPRDPPTTLYCACLGRLGQLGNQIFQFAFATLCARIHSLDLVAPDWIGRYCFPSASKCATAPPASRVLVADRVVLSHAGWRTWASQRAPLSSFGELSGKRLRAEMPQVNASSLLATGALCCAGAQHVPPGGCLELWGWFQFGTAEYSPHRAALADAFVLAPALQALVDSALAIVLDGAETLVCVHVRCSDDYAALADGAYARGGGGAGVDRGWRRRPADGDEAAEAVDLPPEWRDDGIFWAAPVEWYCAWLRELWPKLRAPRLLLCTDDAGRALGGGLAEFAPAQLAPLLRADAGRWAAAHAACGDALTDGALEMLCDWAVMRAADVIAVSNSTFSFSAALLADAPRTAPPPDVARFWRPHPAQRRLVPFEPWDASPTLNAATFEKGDTAHASPQTTM